MKAIVKAVVVWIAALTRINIFPWTLLSRFLGGGGIKTKWGPLSMLRSFFSSSEGGREKGESFEKKKGSKNQVRGGDAGGAVKGGSRFENGWRRKPVAGFVFVTLAFGLIFLLVFH